MVVDTSVVLAVFFNEPHAAWAAARLTEHSENCGILTLDPDFRAVDRPVLMP